MSAPRHVRYAAETPLMSSCELDMRELSGSKTETLRDDVLFEKEKITIERHGFSPFQRWYREIASVKKRQRTIAWKTGKPFVPENLFFRTVDTARLLPMNLADFRIQIYATKGLWAPMEQNGNTESWTNITILGLMHHMLVFRNMQDYAGGDIPIVCIDWDKELVDAAMDYWVELSADKWTKEECETKFCQVAAKVHGRNPCFYQVDLCVRALLLDKDVGYVPPFIVILEARKDGKARALFTRPSHCPPPSILNTLPKTCGSATCTDSKCIGMWRIEDCRSLHYPSPMIRELQRYEDRVVCNLWGCEVKPELDADGKVVGLQRCQKCKEVLYCCREHQSVDWYTHKRVCEAPP
ncbi:uncharacterized protein EV420DRAFT_604756 [Desarmillaria tabescens]|uniref:MYND-type domain-containing protein n=1 Tax=Armillaria tabescens TaxID=1929756 RepID=A0AA39K419_ARMTA|nr:uncharacterized protein EV420DRAFT_604756 [Desarmillaria tabescens]KAK0454192.1 hypothetical protein EV420DRAFT_604756 [Desarmillaria tabescens]